MSSTGLTGGVSTGAASGFSGAIRRTRRRGGLAAGGGPSGQSITSVDGGSSGPRGRSRSTGGATAAEGADATVRGESRTGGTLGSAGAAGSCDAGIRLNEIGVVTAAGQFNSESRGGSSAGRKRNGDAG